MSLRIVFNSLVVGCHFALWNPADQSATLSVKISSRRSLRGCVMPKQRCNISICTVRNGKNYLSRPHFSCSMCLLTGALFLFIMHGVPEQCVSVAWLTKHSKLLDRAATDSEMLVAFYTTAHGSYRVARLYCAALFWAVFLCYFFLFYVTSYEVTRWNTCFTL